MKLSLTLSILLLSLHAFSACFPDTEEEGSYKGELLNGLAHGEGKCKGKRGKTTYKRIKGNWVNGFPQGQIKIAYWAGSPVAYFDGSVKQEPDPFYGLKILKNDMQQLGYYPIGNTIRAPIKISFIEGNVLYSKVSNQIDSHEGFYDGPLDPNAAFPRYPLAKGKGIRTNQDHTRIAGTFSSKLYKNRTQYNVDGNYTIGLELMNGEATYVSYFGQVSKGEVKNGDFICYENCPTESGEIMKALAWFAIKNYAINKYQRKQQAEIEEDCRVAKLLKETKCIF